MIKEVEQLKYPTGRFRYTGPYDEATRAEYLDKIRQFPAQLKELTANLTDAQLEQGYRPDGWTIRQVIHHVADSHMNSYIRFKLGLTEDTPRITGYDEAAWAELIDTANTPVSVSVQLLEALHARWITLLENFTAADWERTVFHPERKAEVSLNEFLALYAWHGTHHLAHIRIALEH